ncbi:hypothetical protein L1887_53793 [Cichorium endivia]|nr:hypothetical protein L1887_53793 [Cichorium endivia]
MLSWAREMISTSTPSRPAAAVDAGDPGQGAVAVEHQAHLRRAEEQVLGAIIGDQETETVAVAGDAAEDQVELVHRGIGAAPGIDKLAITLHGAQATTQGFDLVLAPGAVRIVRTTATDTVVIVEKPYDVKPWQASKRNQRKCPDGEIDQRSGIYATRYTVNVSNASTFAQMVKLVDTPASGSPPHRSCVRPKAAHVLAIARGIRILAATGIGHAPEHQGLRIEQVRQRHAPLTLVIVIEVVTLLALETEVLVLRLHADLQAVGQVVLPLPAHAAGLVLGVVVGVVVLEQRGQRHVVQRALVVVPGVEHAGVVVVPGLGVVFFVVVVTVVVVAIGEATHQHIMVAGNLETALGGGVVDHAGRADRLGHLPGVVETIEEHRADLGHGGHAVALVDVAVVTKAQRRRTMPLAAHVDALAVFAEHAQHLLGHVAGGNLGEQRLGLAGLAVFEQGARQLQAGADKTGLQLIGPPQMRRWPACTCARKRSIRPSAISTSAGSWPGSCR